MRARTSEKARPCSSQHGCGALMHSGALNQLSPPLLYCIWSSTERDLFLFISVLKLSLHAPL